MSGVAGRFQISVERSRRWGLIEAFEGYGCELRVVRRFELAVVSLACMKMRDEGSRAASSLKDGGGGRRRSCGSVLTVSAGALRRQGSETPGRSTSSALLLRLHRAHRGRDRGSAASRPQTCADAKARTAACRRRHRPGSRNGRGRGRHWWRHDAGDGRGIIGGAAPTRPWPHRGRRRRRSPHPRWAPRRRLASLWRWRGRGADQYAAAFAGPVALATSPSFLRPGFRLVPGQVDARPFAVHAFGVVTSSPFLTVGWRMYGLFFPVRRRSTQFRPSWWLGAAMLRACPSRI